ncbi:MAG: ATP-binding cassette domain-containing protein [Desulfovibrio sp.]|nr:MAG: ATP-binding cassette domain-containing protein [Desulfovibrio sp.]
MPSLLTVDNLGKRFTGRERETAALAVDQVSFTLEQGETLGLVGESGCGKSTLARMIVGLTRPSSGQVLIQGRELWNDKSVAPQLKRELPSLVQLVFQDPYSSLNPRRSIGATVREPLDIHRLGTRSERRQTMETLLSQVGIPPDQASRLPHEFSGGQRQRIAIARALVLKPRLLVCDEPVSALDVSIQAQILNLLSQLKLELGLSYLFISHDLAVVAHMSRRIMVMFQGRVMETGPTDQLITEPLHPYTQLLLDSAPDPYEVLAREPSSTDASNTPDLLLSHGEGCSFRDRCSHVLALCADQAPALREIQPGRFTACHWAASA